MLNGIKMKERLKKIFCNRILVTIMLLLFPLLIDIVFFKNYKLEINMEHIFIVLYQYLVYLFIFAFYFLNKRSKKIKKIFEIIIKYRYVIALLTCLCLVCLKVNFSSIGMWTTYLSEDNNTITIGIPRSIRSDEWVVQTPYMFAQSMSENKYELNNENVGNGQNMLLVNAPVKGILIFTKILNLGFLLFGRDYGFSFYFVVKLIGLLLVSIEICLILTKKDACLSIIGGFWIAFSPPLMWWLATSVTDIILYGFAIIIIFHYFVSIENLKLYKKILLALLMIIMISSFAMSLYPAMLVPFAYFMLVFLFVEWLKYRKNLNWKDYLIMIITVIISLALIGYSIYISWDDITKEMSTVYPGARFEMGGNTKLTSLINYFCCIFSPYTRNQKMTFSNYSEISSYIYPITGLLIVIISFFKDFSTIKDKVKNKENWLFIGLLMVYVFLMLFVFVGYNGIVSRITLLYFVPPKRAMLVIGLIGIILSLIILSKLSKNDKKIFTKLQAMLISILVVLISYILIFESGYNSYLGKKEILVLIPIIFALTYNFICANKKAFAYTICIVTLFTGMTVNPIVFGTGNIYNTDISKELQRIESIDPNARWAASGNVYGQLLVANGIDSLNGVHYSPDFEWLNTIDPKSEFSDIYNRYAHISIELGSKINFKLNSMDSYTVTITYSKLKELGIKYFYTNNLIDDETVSEFHLEKIYDNKNQRIYLIN